MSAQVVLTPTTLPEGACYANEQERLNEFASHVVGELPGNYSAVNYGTSTPAVNDRDKPWYRLNPDGSPDGWYSFFNGSWKRPHTLSTGITTLWTGNAALIDTLDGGSAGVVTIQSGPFWQIVTALSAKFPLGVGTLLSGAAVAVGATDGEEKHALLTAELPTVLGTLKDPFTKLLGTVSSGGTNGENAGGSVARSEMSNVIKGGDGTAHNNMPPWYGVYFIQRTGRFFYSQ